MLRQYRPQRHRYEQLRDGRQHAVGTLPVGTIFRMPTTYHSGDNVRLRKFIVTAWKPRRIGAGRMANAGNRRFYADMFVASGGHLATVTCLTDGKRTTMTDLEIRRWVDLDVQWIAPRIPPMIPPRKHHTSLTLRTSEGTFFDFDRAA